MGKFIKNHKWIKAIIILLVLLMILLLAALLFLKLWPAFGGRASAEDRKNYEARAENYRDGKFYNDGDFQIVRETERTDEYIMSPKETKPEGELPVAEPAFDEELPSIDLLILSHDHYDHLDYNVIKEIDEKVKQYIVPLGVENHLEHWGVEEKKIQNMAWWEETTVGGLTVGCTPARHYSGRSLNDQFATLWASWVFQDEYHKVFESGDSGYGSQYEKIRDKYGEFDFVMTDCAQYDVNWPEVHMFPEEAVQAARTLGAKASMPIHWGAFTLANHPWDDSAERFVAAGEQAGLQIVTPQIGETMNLNSMESSMKRWWKDIL